MQHEIQNQGTTHSVPPVASVNAAQKQANVRLPTLHKGFGIVFLLAACLLIILEAVGIALINKQHLYYTVYYNGIYCGIFTGVTGMLALIAGVRDSRCSVIAALVLDIFTAIVTVIAVSLAIIEFMFGMYFNYFYTRNTEHDYNFGVNSYKTTANPMLKALMEAIKDAYYMNLVKSGIVAAVSGVIFILSIVHSGFCCYECCCQPRPAAVCPNQIMVHQQQAPVPMATYYSNQPMYNNMPMSGQYMSQVSPQPGPSYYAAPQAQYGMANYPLPMLPVEGQYPNNISAISGSQNRGPPSYDVIKPSENTG